jgi:hypothetical protein
VLCGQFLEEFDIMVEHWTEWAASVVATWPDDITTAKPALDALEAQARRAETRPTQTAQSVPPRIP